jgi:hypothetical protein
MPYAILQAALTFFGRRPKFLAVDGTDSEVRGLSVVGASERKNAKEKTGTPAGNKNAPHEL